MDTRVEQEVFGLDLMDTEGTDKLHEHIHFDLEAGGLFEVHPKVTRTSPEASEEHRNVTKQRSFLERYGSSENIGRTM